ncbi:MAG: PAS domain-containing protein [Pseudomonadota bacterium]
MHHRGTLQLFHYWTQQRGDRAAPNRSDISPAAISNILGNTFILEGDAGDAGFRLAGTRLCNAFGRELRGSTLIDLFTPRDRILMAKAANTVFNGGNIVVGDAVADAGADKHISLELLLMPLGDQQMRILGSIQFLEQPYWLGSAPLGKIDLVTLKHADPDTELVSLSNRPPVMLPEQRQQDRRARFWHVLDGGRHEASASVERARGFSVINGGRVDP